jgi:signal recognition particle subunit SRP19
LIRKTILSLDVNASKQLNPQETLGDRVKLPQLIKHSKSIAKQIKMRNKNKIILWSIYFDSNKTRADGRRVPKKLAVSAPKLEEIQRAAKRLGLQPEVVPGAAHPSSPWLKIGLLIVPKTESKDKTVKKIAEELCQLRR